MAKFTADTDADYKGAASSGNTLGGNRAARPGLIKGDDGVYYVACIATAGASEQGCNIYSVSDGSLVHILDDVDVTSDLNDGVTYTNYVNGGPVGDGVHVWVMAGRAALNSRVAIVFYKIGSDGNPAMNGWAKHQYSGGGAGFDDGDAVAAHLFADGKFVILFDDAGVLKSVCTTGPGATTDETGSYSAGLYPWNNRQVTIEDAAIIEAATFSENAYMIMENAGFFADDTFYSFYSKSDCDYQNTFGGLAAPVDLEYSNYPNGFMAKFSHSFGTSNGYPTFDITGYSVDNANWDTIPISDDAKSRADADDPNDRYWRCAAPVRLSGGNYLVMLLKEYDDSTDLASTGTYWRIRGYTGTASSGWREVFDIEGNGYHMVNDAGIDPESIYGDSHIPRTNYALWHPDDTAGVIYIHEQQSSGAPTPITSDYVLSAFGTLFITGGYAVLNVN